MSSDSPKLRKYNCPSVNHFIVRKIGRRTFISQTSTLACLGAVGFANEPLEKPTVQQPHNPSPKGTDSNNNPHNCLSTEGQLTIPTFEYPGYDLPAATAEFAMAKRDAEHLRKTHEQIKQAAKDATLELDKKPEDLKAALETLMDAVKQFEARNLKHRTTWFKLYKGLSGTVVGPDKPTRMPRNPTTTLKITNDCDVDIAGEITAISETQTSKNNNRDEGIIKTPALNTATPFSVSADATEELLLTLYPNYGSVEFKLEYKANGNARTLNTTVNISGPWEHPGIRQEIYDHYLAAASLARSWLNQFAHLVALGKNGAATAQTFIGEAKARAELRAGQLKAENIKLEAEITQVKGNSPGSSIGHSEIERLEVKLVDNKKLIDEFSAIIENTVPEADAYLDALHARLDTMSQENRTRFEDHRSVIQAFHDASQAAAETYPESGTKGEEEQEHAVDWNARLAREIAKMK